MEKQNEPLQSNESQQAVSASALRTDELSSPDRIESRGPPLMIPPENDVQWLEHADEERIALPFSESGNGFNATARFWTDEERTKKRRRRSVEATSVHSSQDQAELYLPDAIVQTDSAKPASLTTDSFSQISETKSQEPSTPTSAQELEFITGFSIDEGPTKVKELRERDLAPRKDSPNDILKMQRQALILRHADDPAVALIERSGLAKLDTETKAELASVKAHQYRQQRNDVEYKFDMMKKEFKKQREQATYYQRMFKAYKRQFDRIQPLAMERDDFEEETEQLKQETEQLKQELEKVKTDAEHAHARREQLEEIARARDGQWKRLTARHSNPHVAIENVLTIMDKLTNEKETYRQDCERQRRLLEDLYVYLEEKRIAEEKPQVAPAPSIQYIICNNCPDPPSPTMLALPRNIWTPIRLLETTPRWKARERSIRNTAQWDTNRKLALQRLTMGTVAG